MRGILSYLCFYERGCGGLNVVISRPPVHRLCIVRPLNPLIFSLNKEKVPPSPMQMTTRRSLLGVERGVGGVCGDSRRVC